jgi:hypothetical protein
MTPRTTRIAAIAMLALALAGAACTGNSDAVDTPGAPSTLPNGEQPTTVPPPTAAPTTLPPPTPTTTTTTTTVAPTTTEAPTVTTSPATTATAAAPNPEFLRQGDEGPRVGLIQFKLVALGYLPTGGDTGVFDAATNSAVLAFQGDYGLIVDGIIGPETERAISAAAESINPEQ